jgi:hypothetical protein
MSKPDELPKFAVLGFDAERGRILVKFIDAPKSGDGSLRVKRDKEQFVLPAGGFVRHFDLAGKASAFDVECHDEGRRLVLSPRNTPTAAAAIVTTDAAAPVAAVRR